MNKIEKMASKDAYEYGLALMSFGEGAGTRRKLTSAMIEGKTRDIPGYAEAFQKSFEKLDQVKLAEKAISERKRLDAMAKASRNVRALKSGRYHNLTSGALVVAGGVWLARETGYDKKIEAEMKKQWASAKEQFQSVMHARKVRQMKMRAERMGENS